MIQHNQSNIIDATLKKKDFDIIENTSGVITFDNALHHASNINPESSLNFLSSKVLMHKFNTLH